MFIINASLVFLGQQMEFKLTIKDHDGVFEKESVKEELFPILLKDMYKKTQKGEKCFIFKADTGIGKSTYFLKLLFDTFPDYKIQCTQPTILNATSIPTYMAQKYGLQMGINLGTLTSKLKINITQPGIIYTTVGSSLQIFLKQGGAKPGDKVIVVIDEAHLNSVELTMFIALMKDQYDQNISPIFVIQSASINAQELQQYFGTDHYYEVMGKKSKISKFYLDDLIPKEQLTKLDMAAAACLMISNILRQNNEKINKEVQQMNINPQSGILVFVTGEQLKKQIFQKIKDDHSIKVPIYTLSSKDVNESNLQLINSPGTRIIIATNVAETGVTIENLSFVVDCLKCKISFYNPNLKMQYLRDVPISKGMQQQRMGRVGRISNGMYIGLCAKEYGEQIMQNRENSIQVDDLRLNALNYGLDVLLGLQLQHPLLPEQILDFHQTRLYLNYEENNKSETFRNFMFSINELEYIFDRYFLFLCFQYGFKMADVIQFFAYIDNNKAARPFQKMPIFKGRNDIQLILKYINDAKLQTLGVECSKKFMYLAESFGAIKINIFQGKQILYDFPLFSKLFCWAYQINCFYLHQVNENRCTYVSKIGQYLNFEFFKQQEPPKKIVIRKISDQIRLQGDFLLDASNEDFIIEKFCEK